MVRYRERQVRDRNRYYRKLLYESSLMLLSYPIEYYGRYFKYWMR
jgi:hypothetical protein